MAKAIVRILDDISPSELKLRNMSRPTDGLNNMFINELGQAEKRKGYVKYNDDVIAAGSYKIVGMHRFYKQDTSSKEFLVAWNTSLYKLPDTEDHKAVALTNCPALTANSDTHFTDFLNHCYIVNGADAMMKYDLDNVRTVGPAPPAAKPTGTHTGTGGLLGTGNYKFCYTYIDEDGYESNASPVSDDIPVIAGEIVTLTIVNSDDLKITKRSVYRTSVGGAIYYYDGEVEFLVSTDWTSGGWTGDFASGWKHTIENTSVLNQSKDAVIGIAYHITYTVTGRTAGTFTIGFGGQTSSAISASGVWKPTASSTANLTITPTSTFDGTIVISINDTTFISSQKDTTLGTELQTNHDAPPTGAQLISKRGNRLYLGKDDDLVISHLSDVEYFPPAWFMKTGNRHKIKGMTKQLNALPIFTENSIERLIGTDEDNFEFRNAFSEKGNCAVRSLVICDNLLKYLSYDGIYYFDGTTSDIFNQRLNKYIRDNINRSFIHLSCATYFNDRYMLSYPKKPSEVPNETIVIDMKSKAISVYSYGFSCFNKWDKGELRLFGGSNIIGRVYEIAGLTDYDETTEKDVAIACYDKLDPIDFGIPDRYKQFYDIYIKVKSTTGTALTFYYQFDDEDETHADLTLTPDTERWYRIRLEGGGQRARTITPKPYVSDAYDVTFCGYMFVFDVEAPEYA